MAKIKLLTRKDVLLKNDDLGVSLKLGRLLPEHVSEMRRMFLTREDAAASIAMYAMRHSMSELHNDNEDLDPVFVSYNIDTTDKEVSPFIYAVAAIVTDAVLIPDADKKKSNMPSEPIGAENAAPDAQEPTTEASANPHPSSSKD